MIWNMMVRVPCVTTGLIRIFGWLTAETNVDLDRYFECFQCFSRHVATVDEETVKDVSAVTQTIKYTHCT